MSTQRGHRTPTMLPGEMHYAFCDLQTCGVNPGQPRKSIPKSPPLSLCILGSTLRKSTWLIEQQKDLFGCALEKATQTSPSFVLRMMSFPLLPAKFHLVVRFWWKIALLQPMLGGQCPEFIGLSSDGLKWTDRWELFPICFNARDKVFCYLQTKQWQNEYALWKETEGNVPLKLNCPNCGRKLITCAILVSEVKLNSKAVSFQRNLKRNFMIQLILFTRLRHSRETKLQTEPGINFVIEEYSIF